MLNDNERDRIAAAVTEAEAKTSGEIVCVMAGRTSDYGETPLAWAAAAALVIPPVALAVGLDPLIIGRWMGGWTAGHVGALRMALSGALGVYAMTQLVLFVAVWIIVGLPGVRRVLTPRPLKLRRVRQAALAQLAAASLAAGASRAAVVIFAALDERIVDVVSTEAVHAAAGQAVWDQAVSQVLTAIKAGKPADGFVAAVQTCGAALAGHFPQDAADDNAIPNRPLEL
jgi:putative membrane protein